MTLIISIESTELNAKTSKANKPYYTQTAYAQTTNKDGSPKRYPEQFELFTKKDPQGNAVPYPKGNYELSANSFQVERGFLNMNFPDLQPIKK